VLECVLQCIVRSVHLQQVVLASGSTMQPWDGPDPILALAGRPWEWVSGVGKLVFISNICIGPSDIHDVSEG
jgi:hypothetical protein